MAARRSATTILGRLAVGLVASAAILAGPGSALAQVQVLVDTVDELYAAIDQVNANTGSSYDIQLAAGTYALTRPLHVTGGSAIITGSLQNPDSRRISGQDSVQVVRIIGGGGGAFVHLRGVTIENGRTLDTGGGIVSSNASLYVENSIVRNNTSLGFGPGIYAQNTSGIVYIERTLIQNNAGSSVAGGRCGGGFFTNGGGVMFSSVAEAYIFNSTIVDNRHCRWGGVASINSSTVLVQNTIARNEGIENGGGVVARGSGSLRMAFNTVSENRANLNMQGASQPRKGAGLFLYDFSGNVQLNGNIFANNLNFNGGVQPGAATGEDFWAHPSQPPFGGFTVTTYLNNFRNWTMPVIADNMGIDDGYVGTNPELGPLQVNGAASITFPMPTYLVGPQSPMLRAYTPLDGWLGPFTADQRGLARPGPAVTIGSTEP